MGMMHTMRFGLVGAGVLAFSAGASLAQPVNDDCADAITVGVGSVVAGTTIGATGTDITDCTDGDAADVWYRFDAIATETVYAQTCGPVVFNSSLAVFDACGGTQLACNDDACGVAAVVEINAVAGQSYLIRVSGPGGGTGLFRFSMTDVPPDITVGPDVIVGDLPSTRRWGALGGQVSFSVATTSCNLGDENLKWIAGTREHPVIGQNMYRLKDGRFEQVGQSWLKHGFLALAQNLCDTCQNPGTGSRLGVGCSDPYGSFLNGDQDGLGPRSTVNASNGFFVYPDPVISQTGDVLYKRLIVDQTDIETNANGTRYFVEGHYVTPDDAAAGNGLNNASYREVRFNSVNGTPVNVAPTVREQPAIMAWADSDPEVVLSMADYLDSGLKARFYVGSRAYDNQDGTWTYEYAVFNLNSHRSGGAFSVPVGAPTTVTNIDFRDSDSHSGEPYDTTDWSGEKQLDTVRWWCPETFDVNPDSNALRWSTLYNFRFLADAPPANGQVKIDLFRPNPTGADEVFADAVVPASVQCAADWNSDGFLNDTDFFDWVNDYFSASGPQGQSDFNDDTFENAQDWFDFINAFFNAGPECD